MRKTVSIGLSLLLFACSGEAPPPVDPEPQQDIGVTNRAPVIDALRLLPREPTGRDTLSVSVQARDPDRNTLDVEVAWYRNGALLESGERTTLDAAGLFRGDRVHAVVSVSDGEAEVSEQSPPVVIGNSPPQITRLELEPDDATGADDLMATIEAEDPEGDTIEYRYEWQKGEIVLVGVDGAVLAAEHFRRGDEIEVRVQPFDGEDFGAPVRSQRIRIRNAPPRITSEPASAKIGIDRYEYAVVAEDPDDDAPLRFELREGPEGMDIDLVSGVLVWEVPSSFAGSSTVEVAVRDPYGGEARQRYSLDVSWEAPATRATASEEPAEESEAPEIDPLLAPPADLP